MRISSKLRWFILILVVFTSLSIALIGYWGNSVIISDLQKEALEMRSKLEIDRLEFAFTELDNDIRFIENLPMVQRLATAEFDDEASRSEAKDDLAVIFEQILKTKPYYAQIRLIKRAESGLESVRMDQRDGVIRRVSEDELQMKAGRDYFIEASQRRSGEVYYSEINLNREDGVVELPMRPMLRVAMPVYGKSDALYGIVVINLNFDIFINRVLRMGLDRSRYEYYLLNQAGYYLFHPDPSNTFGFDLGMELKAEHDFLKLKNFSTSAANSITFRLEADAEATDCLVHFTKFKLLDPQRELVFGVVGSYDDIGRASILTLVEVVIAMCVLMLVALVLAIRFSFQITNPLERIISATKSLATSEADHIALPTDRSDEIGELARTFLQMKVSIEKHQSHLTQANQRLFEMNRDLEHFARVASHDLREPIQRIASLASLYHAECAGCGSEGSEGLLQQLHLECEKALGQIQDFREFTGITHDSSLLREECQLDELIRSTLNEFTEALEQRGVDVEIDSMPTLSLYRNLVQVLYRNLIDNTLKHVKVDGYKLHFTCEEDDAGHVVFGVRNTASNIAEGDAEKVFDVFSQLGECSQGHGIGLAICKRIINFHTGMIWVESNGNCVHIKFNFGEVSKNEDS